MSKVDQVKIRSIRNSKGDLFVSLDDLILAFITERNEFDEAGLLEDKKNTDLLIKQLQTIYDV